MNAIISLCHFCEFHGPSILFCTQPLHCSEHDPLSGNQNKSHDCETSVQSYFQSQTSSESEEGATRQRGTASKTSECEACRSLPPGQQLGYYCVDAEHHVCYVSSRYPQNPELYSMVRQACVRSLSCEVCPGREGPMFFGEEGTGYVFTHTFFLRDTQARGLQRWCSIIAVMMDKIYLINSWPFLCSQFRNLIDKMQEKANEAFAAEQAVKPQRSQRIQSSTNGLLLTPDQFRRKRGGNMQFRCLADVTRDKNLFRDLHTSFTWILRACGSRITEILLEGPPREGMDESAPVLKDDSDPEESSDEEGDATTTASFKSLRHLLQLVGPEKFHLLASHILIGNQLIVRGSNRHIVQSALTTLQCLIPSGCCTVIPYTKTYKDFWKCNFLGMTLETSVPDHVLQTDMFVLLDIISPAVEVGDNTEDAALKETDQHFRGYVFDVTGKEKQKHPSILQKLESFFFNNSLPDSVIDHMLACLKEEWLDKVKVIFKFSRSGPHNKEEKEKLLQVLGAKSEDEIVLKFWMTALNKQYRSHLLTCSGQSQQS